MAHPIHHLLAAAISVLGALVLPACADEGRPRPKASPPAVLVERDGPWEYTYHVVTGSEALFDLAHDPRRLQNLVEVEGTRARTLRDRLETRLGVPDLSEVLPPDDPRRRALEQMGYL